MVSGITLTNISLKICKWSLTMILCTRELTVNLWMCTTKARECLSGTSKPWGFTSSHLSHILSCCYLQESCRKHSSHLNLSHFPFFCGFLSRCLLCFGGFNGLISLPLFQEIIWNERDLFLCFCSTMFLKLPRIIF